MYTYHLFKIDGRATIQATHESGEVVGSMFLRGNTVRSVWVDAPHRRKGVATGLWNFAVDSGIEPVHSRFQTKLGQLWINSLTEK